MITRTTTLQLPHALAQRITDFLQSLPNILERSMRQTLITNATLDARLEAQIDIDAPPAQFVSKLIAVLARYGELEDQRHALIAVLTSARQYIGPNRQSECDTLIRAIEQRIQPPQIEPEKSSSLTRIAAQHPVRIFLSYTRADHAAVKVLYDHLQEAGLIPWMDTEDLLPGQRFEREIRKAIRSADFFLACLSKQAIDRRGFIQREIGEALDILQEKLDDDIFVIPVRLEECDVPERLREFHWAELYRSDGLRKLLKAIQAQCAHRSSVKAREPQIGDAWTEPVTGMEFVWIPPGRFMMGQTEAEKAWLIKEVGQENYQSWYARELPRHQVTITQGFWLGKYPVTNAEYRKFNKQHDSGSYEGHSLNGEKQPVVQVNWDEATAFIEWLNKQNNGQQSFRLPSEAEWEYACRAGTDTMFFWGNAPGDAARYANGADQAFGKAFPKLAKEWEQQYKWKLFDCDDGYAVTSPVGSFQPNAWGLYDMLGNVWEWCADPWHDSYTGAPTDGRVWEKDGDVNKRLLHGGSWLDNPWNLRCAGRYWLVRDDRLDLVGLRVVVSSAVR